MSTAHLTAPIDTESAGRLAAAGLRLGLVDTTDTAAFTAWIQVESRGFHSPQMTDKSLAEQRARHSELRLTGVWDDTEDTPAEPVATSNSWIKPLTVPGRRDVPAWAISAVTVSPTHRRKGIARAILESELRTADALGIPVAVLTVSESTIYRRFGFAPSAMSVDLTINTARASWAGPAASGRLHFVTTEQLREQGPAIMARVRLARSGQVEVDSFHWERMLGLVADDDDTAKNLRAVRYDDTDGIAQGFAVYSVKDAESPFFSFTADVRYLVSATADAANGLWRFLLELDLVTELRAPLRATDDPLPWQVSDFRAVVRTNERDHLWVRILDVPAALQSRGFAANGVLALSITDPLGFAEGRFLVDIAGGEATVTALADDDPLPTGCAAVALGVTELGAVYLGGVPATTMLGAGLLAELTPDAAAAVDRSFRSPVAPLCDFWF